MELNPFLRGWTSLTMRTLEGSGLVMDHHVTFTDSFQVVFWIPTPPFLWGSETLLPAL